MNIVWFKDNFVVIFVWSIFIICICLFLVFMYPNPIINTDKSMYIKDDKVSKQECNIQPLDIKVIMPEQTVVPIVEEKPIVYNITINNYGTNTSTKVNKNKQEVLLDTKDMQILIKK